jgi:hypothetical protein
MDEFMDDFGKIMVFGDYEGDLKAIVDNLNSLQWGIGGQWAVKQSRVPGGGARREIIAPKGDYNATLRCTLSELSAFISPHLNKGTIEFVAVRASWSDIWHERLLVRSDGSAEYHKCISDMADSESYPETMYYEPESSKGARSRKHSRSRGSRSGSGVVVDRVVTR